MKVIKIFTLMNGVTLVKYVKLFAQLKILKL